MKGTPTSSTYPQKYLQHIYGSMVIAYKSQTSNSYRWLIILIAIEMIICHLEDIFSSNWGVGNNQSNLQ